MPICLVGGAKVAVVTAELFSVSWTIAATGAEWQRAYHGAPGAIVSGELKARAMSADAEAPLPGAQREGDWFVWRTARRAFPVVSFGADPGTRDWKVCWDGTCKPLAELTGVPEGRDVTAVPCKADAVP
ncbi:DUF1850 domain-containing protein [Prosthecodimorpha staleyi]|uniref:DUF1850 domain-containing protein n=1 Tax=Prosthecodimorpha staleyi TaxID=2840188 RepID=A0A947D0W7_9HYPH|nr:DUF1850 domain-containing protein [Prosthecodimorpha staleyi]MBT9288203.1 DUF1850 domain-containing protein [Prosthecodimorpha staleyi]